MHNKTPFDLEYSSFSSLIGEGNSIDSCRGDVSSKLFPEFGIVFTSFFHLTKEVLANSPEPPEPPLRLRSAI